MFEELFKKVGEKVDKVAKEINVKVTETSQRIIKKAEKSREEMSDEFMKKMAKFGERMSPDSKGLSNFERTAASIAIGVAHSLEEGYKKVTKSLFLTEKEKKTKYGTLGRLWSEKYVPKERGKLCLNFVDFVNIKLGNKKLNKEILKDIVESLSINNSELYNYYVYIHIIGGKRTKNHEEKKSIVKEKLMKNGKMS